MKINLLELCKPKQWKTLLTNELVSNGKYYVYGANGIIGKYTKYNHEKPTILITCRGATCGNIHLSKPYSYINGNAMSLDDLDESKCLKEYLYYFLKGIDLNNLISGTAQPQITIQSLKNVYIKIYSLDIQKKIVSILSHIDKLIENKKIEIEKCNYLIKSQFVEMFEACNLIKLGELAKISRGASPRPINRYITSDEKGINWIKIGDVSDTSLYITKAKEKITELGALKSKKVYNGDFILSNSMSFGRPYILRIDGCVHDGWLIISDFKKSFNELYLYYALRDEYVQKQFKGKVNGTTVKNLNSDLVKSTYVKVPPIELQNKFANIVEQIDKQKFIIEQIEKIVNKNQFIKCNYIDNNVILNIKLTSCITYDII